MGQEPGASEVGRDHGIEVSDWSAFDRAHPECPRSQEHPVPWFAIGSECSHRSLVRMIQWGVVHVWKRFLKGPKVSAHQFQVRSALSEQPRCGPANPATGARDQDPLARKGLPRGCGSGVQRKAPLTGRSRVPQPRT